jgi:hypothetical protein
MTKKNTNAQEILDAIEATPVTETKTDDDKAYDRAQDAIYSRRRSLEAALEHHKINGGMLTVEQLLANSVKFHAYITGEQA